MRKNPVSDEAGFTLTEVIVVMAIVGAGLGTWESLGVAVVEVCFAATLISGFIGVRLVGGELVAGNRA